MKSAQVREVLIHGLGGEAAVRGDLATVGRFGCPWGVRHQSFVPESNLIQLGIKLAHGVLPERGFLFVPI